MDFAAMQRRALGLSQLYDQLNTARGQGEWEAKDLMLGLVGDVGDLVQAVQVAEGTREPSDDIRSIEHELADCLWSILVLADRCGINLPIAFERTMDELELKVQASIAGAEEGR